MLQYAHENGCPWDARACAGAALDGHLDVLQWAIDNGCPWNEEVCKWAAWGSYLDVLQWAIDNGCPYEVNEYTRRALESLGLA